MLSFKCKRWLVSKLRSFLAPQDSLVNRFDLPALVQVVQQVVCTSSCPNEKPSGRERDISRLLELLMGSMWFLLHPESPELQYSTDQQLSISHKHQWSLVVQTAEFTGTRKKCA
ncbi:uncharacterized, partial [Tachysurus ichikawai]